MEGEEGSFEETCLECLTCSESGISALARTLRGLSLNDLYCLLGLGLTCILIAGILVMLKSFRMQCEEAFSR
jgi:hypothetical protein